MRGAGDDGRDDCRRAAQSGGATCWGEVRIPQARLRVTTLAHTTLPPLWADRGAPGAAAGIDRS